MVVESVTSFLQECGRFSYLVPGIQRSAAECLELMHYMQDQVAPH